MSTGDVKKYMSEYKVKEVKWINDSSCKSAFYTIGNVEFENAEEA
jgi:hypothetical protein